MLTNINVRSLVDENGVKMSHQMMEKPRFSVGDVVQFRSAEMTFCGVVVSVEYFSKFQAFNEEIAPGIYYGITPNCLESFESIDFYNRSKKGSVLVSDSSIGDTIEELMIDENGVPVMGNFSEGLNF